MSIYGRIVLKLRFLPCLLHVCIVRYDEPALLKDIEKRLGSEVTR